MSDERPQDVGPPATPWFTVALSLGVTFNVAWTITVGAVAALLCVGEPDLIDALVFYIWNRP